MNQEDVFAQRSPDRVRAQARGAGAGEPGGRAESVTRDEVEGLLQRWRLGSADVLSAHQFADLVARERARSDRSRAPLSLAVWARHDEALHELRLLVELLRENKRDSDQIGCIDDHRLAVLLPDTDRGGASCFAAKFEAFSDGRFRALAVHSYPDELFDALLAQQPAASGMRPLLLPAARTAVRGGYPGKRLFDVLVALALLVLLAPVMACITLAIVLSSRGPVVFKQVRLGAGGVPFVFYKFRSMFCGMDDAIHRHYVASLIEGDHERINEGDAQRPVYKLRRDPRVTPVGRFIRKTSLDELPQLVNVLKGDMSLVGPRPPIPYEVERYQPWHLRRVLEVKPGITGLWQVKGRSRTCFDDMVRLDLRYVRECSFRLDLAILLRTVAVVLRGDGAS